MTQTTNRFFDEIARMMTDAAGAAQGLRREFETFMKSQGERVLREMDVVRREEFEAQLDKEVEIDLQLINAEKFSGVGKDLLNFLSAIQPVLIFSSEEAK